MSIKNGLEVVDCENCGKEDIILRMMEGDNDDEFFCCISCYREYGKNKE